jgi:AbrB family looped-hinge helix DNA binding protein
MRTYPTGAAQRDTGRVYGNGIRLGYTAGMTYRVGVKGQVVLPKAVRERVGINPGDKVTVAEKGGVVQIRKALPGPAEREAIVASLRGALGGGQPLTAALERDRRSERARDERAREGLQAGDRP